MPVTLRSVASAQADQLKKCDIDEVICVMVGEPAEVKAVADKAGSTAVGLPLILAHQDAIGYFGTHNTRCETHACRLVARCWSSLPRL